MAVPALYAGFLLICLVLSSECQTPSTYDATIETIIAEITAALNAPLAKRDEFRVISERTKLHHQGDKVTVELQAENWEHKECSIIASYLPQSHHILSAEYASQSRATTDFQPINELPPGLESLFQRKLDEINDKTQLKCRVDPESTPSVLKKVLPTRGTRFKAKLQIMCSVAADISTFLAEIDAIYAVPKSFQGAEKPSIAAAGKGAFKGMKLLRFTPSELPLNISRGSHLRDEALSAAAELNRRRCADDSLQIVKLLAYKHKSNDGSRYVGLKLSDAFGMIHHINAPVVQESETGRYVLGEDIIHYHPHDVSSDRQSVVVGAEYVRRWLSERLYYVGITTVDVVRIEESLYTPLPSAFVLTLVLEAVDKEGYRIEFRFHAHILRGPDCNFAMDLGAVHGSDMGRLQLSRALREELRQKDCQSDASEASLRVLPSDTLGLTVRSIDGTPCDIRLSLTAGLSPPRMFSQGEPGIVYHTEL